ncbi:MAG: hypothetical protein JXR95_03640 [Deltaproteobacteria bacterium]|nr:hypothetical protein [Deltaproteobacteria bacterium]
MKIRVFFKTIGWGLTVILGVLSLGGGVYLIMRSPEPVTPPPDDEIAMLKKSVASKKGGRNNLRNIAVRDMTKTPGKDNKFKNKPGVPNVMFPMFMPMGPIKSPPSLNKFNDETKAKNRHEYDEAKKNRRLEREKRRYDRMDERIERLDKRLQSLKEGNGTETQIKRLEGSIDRLKKRKKELEDKLKKEGII